MTKIKVTQVKSIIDRPNIQKLTIRSLGLKKMHQSVELEDNPVNMGMVNKVKHLLKIEKI